MDVDFSLAKKAMDEDGEAAENDPFLSEEMELALLLAAAFGLAVSEVRAILDRMFTPPVTAQGIRTGLDQMADRMGRIVTPDTEADILRVTDRAVSNGALDSNASVGGRRPDTPSSVRGGLPVPTGAGTAAAGTILEAAPSARLVRDGIVAASKYYTNRFFNTFIIPEIIQRIELILAGTPFNEVPDLTDLRAILDRRLRSVPYWRLVANAAMSRAYHYGYIKAAELRGVLQYRFVAVLDSRTSEICQAMNGTVFNVSTAARLMERVAEAPDVEQVKTLMPWRKVSEVRGLSPAELEALGVMVPPLHGNCRSTLVIV
jgi:hypothetical protein